MVARRSIRPRALAGAERMGGPDAERREPGELFRVRFLAGGMEQLEDTDRRPAEWQRRRDFAILRQPGGAHAHRPGLGERRLRNRTRRTEIGAGVDPPRGGGDEVSVAALPEDRSRRAGHGGGEADDLRGGMLLVKSSCERLAGQLQRRARERRGVASGREGTENESGQRRTQLGGESLLRAERLAGTEQLDRDRAAVRACRHDENLRGAGSLGDPPHRGRRQR